MKDKQDKKITAEHKDREEHKIAAARFTPDERDTMYSGVFDQPLTGAKIQTKTEERHIVPETASPVIKNKEMRKEEKSDKEQRNRGLDTRDDKFSLNSRQRSSVTRTTEKPEQIRRENERRDRMVELEMRRKELQERQARDEARRKELEKRQRIREERRRERERRKEEKRDWLPLAGGLVVAGIAAKKIYQAKVAEKAAGAEKHIDR